MCPQYDISNKSLELITWRTLDKYQNVWTNYNLRFSKFARKFWKAYKQKRFRRRIIANRTKVQIISNIVTSVWLQLSSAHQFVIALNTSKSMPFATLQPNPCFKSAYFYRFYYNLNLFTVSLISIISKFWYKNSIFDFEMKNYRRKTDDMHLVNAICHCFFL